MVKKHLWFHNSLAAILVLFRFLFRGQQRHGFLLSSRKGTGSGESADCQGREFRIL